MSTIYDINQKYKINISIELTITNVIDHFPNLEGLIFDLLKNTALVEEVLQDNLEKLEGEYSVYTAFFDWAGVVIKNPKIINISKNE